MVIHKSGRGSLRERSLTRAFHYRVEVKSQTGFHSAGRKNSLSLTRVVARRALTVFTKVKARCLQIQLELNSNLIFFKYERPNFELSLSWKCVFLLFGQLKPENVLTMLLSNMIQH